ncbi:restriction endonuclease subunit S [Succinivibrio sp.]|uniref:restriction endonuclease subunit S n=1 Tax=Succinivibrio sp. TaxID=2053619 RepID=UPI0025F2E565|nr:restriction endonuclease subunit S [Succinivibrio sp.]MBQ9221816.1 restriction endonuclease subunit S [Succinivibrio sp.]
MTPQQLRNSILQQAIEGKLVEQRAEEGTAEELYAQIQEEKQKLIAEGKIKKGKSLPEITEDEIPFDIPESWKWVRIGSVINEVIVPQRDKPPFSGNIPWCRIEDREGYFLNGTKSGQYVSEDTIKEMNLKVCPIGTVLNACSGASIGTILVTTVPCCTNQTFNGLVCNKLFFNWYLFWYLNTAITKLKSLSTGSAMGYISQDKMRNMIIPLPPLAEQKRIVAKIEELLPFIDKYEKAYNALEEYNARFPEDMRKSILQQAIEGKLVEQRPEEGTAEELYAQIQEEKKKLIAEGKLKKTKKLPDITQEEFHYFEIPSSWKLCYIDSIAFVTKLAGFEYSKYIAPNMQSSGIPLLKGKNVQDGKIVYQFESYISEQLSDTLERSQIRKKCLLTPYVGTIGNIAIFDGSFRAHLGSNVGKIELIRNNHQFVLEEYLLFYLRSSTGYKELTKYIKATAQESISIDAIRNVILPLPPLAEQKRIVAKIEELLPYCDKLN